VNNTTDSGDVCQIYIDRLPTAPKLRIYRTPATTDTTTWTLKLVVQTYAPNVAPGGVTGTSPSGSVLHGFRLAWQRWLILQLSVDLGGGADRQAAAGEPQQLEGREAAAAKTRARSLRQPRAREHAADRDSSESFESMDSCIVRGNTDGVPRRDPRFPARQPALHRRAGVVLRGRRGRRAHRDARHALRQPDRRAADLEPAGPRQRGQVSRPVYIEGPVIAEASGPNVESHSTGVINARGTWRGDWATGTAAEAARDTALTYKTDAAASATAATAQAVTSAAQAALSAGSAAAAAGYAAALGLTIDYGFFADAPTETRDYGTFP
jgi:hypothetical protein